MAGFFEKLKVGLGKSRNAISETLNSALAGFSKIDEDFLEELEEILVSADVGISTAMEICEKLRGAAKESKISKPEDVKLLLQSIIVDLLSFETKPETFPKAIMIVGVNGVGKTTAIGKLAHVYKQQGKSVILAAGDTFRAAAAEQLQEWGKRSGADNVIRQNEGADAAAVIFDAVQSAKARNTNVLICDTAGRLHNKKSLMDGLGKINRVIDKEFSEANRQTLLVLDATTGQNGIMQAKAFGETVAIDGVILTKLDGTAKGGIVLAIKKELGMPVRYIGIGEGIDDLQPFDAEDFVSALLD